MSQQPKITVITIVRNAAATIEEAIRSVLAQDYPTLEYIIVDGGSTDGTLAIIDRWRPRLARIISEKDQGISDAMNKGIGMATGDLIGLVHADDRLVGGALQAVAEAYCQDSSVDVIHGNCIAFDAETGERFLAKPAPKVNQPFLGQFLKHGSMFVSRQAYRKHGAYDLRYQCAMDYDLVLRLYLAGARMTYLDRPIAELRMYGVSIRASARTRRESRAIAIAHGCPAWRANVYYAYKYLKWLTLQCLLALHLRSAVRAYRRWGRRAVPLAGSV
jgi:glycosyltransferase involved in cell wall biosynthesis